jgi:hypothetical protein
VWVGPGETFTYGCDLTIDTPGPFEAKIHLFLDDRNIREVILAVRGVGVRPKEKSRVIKPSS